MVRTSTDHTFLGRLQNNLEKKWLLLVVWHHTCPQGTICCFPHHCHSQEAVFPALILGSIASRFHIPDRDS